MFTLTEMDTSSESRILDSIRTSSADQTRALAARLAEAIPRPVSILLRGTLGVGKTVFVQGLARGLAVKETVTSPSFLLMKEYRGRHPLRHLDLFRLTKQDEVRSLGLTEDLPEDVVVVVEWAERLDLQLALPTLEVRMTMGDSATQRWLEFSARGLSPEEVTRVENALRLH